MKPIPKTARNVVTGLVLAAALAFVSAEVSAFACYRETTCAEGTALYGFDIGCGCDGAGTCTITSPGHEVRCACDGFELTICTCETGCN